VHRGRFALDLVAALEAAAAAATGGERTILGAVAERAIEETSWAAINVLHLEHLRSALGAAPIELPYLFAEEFGEDELATLTRLLDEAAALPAARSA
jgi:hypothetical protein